MSDPTLPTAHEVAVHCFLRLPDCSGSKGCADPRCRAAASEWLGAPSPASDTATPEPSVTTDAETVEVLERTIKRTERDAERFGPFDARGQTASKDLIVLDALARSLRSARAPEPSIRALSFEEARAHGIIVATPAPESSPAVDAGTTDVARSMKSALGELVIASTVLEALDADDARRAAVHERVQYAAALLRTALRSPAVDDETPKLLAQVAKAAAAFCAELQEDGEGVPQPELRALHAALDAVDLAKLEADWLTHLAVCYRCNEDHRDPCDIGARIRAEMDALDERIDSAAARRSPESAPEANHAK